MNLVDIMFHIHPDLPTEQRSCIEETLSTCEGVISVHFSAEHIHELTIAYNPEVINSKAILEKIRQWDEAATMVGL